MLGCEPYFSEAFYVGFNIGGLALGLDPDVSGFARGNSPVAYWGVPMRRWPTHVCSSSAPGRSVDPGVCIDDVYTGLYISCVYNGGAMPDTAVINLRADKGKRALIDRAAQVVGKNRSEFMLDAACREATAVLLDRRFFHLDEKTYKRFKAALDRPPASNPRMRRLLTTKAPWGR